MQDIVLSFLTAFVIVLVCLPVVIKVARIKHLVDDPKDERKIHSRTIPTVGGIAIFASFLFTAAFYADTGLLIDISKNSNEFFRYFICGILVLFFVGLKDDLIGFKANKKLLAQIVTAGIVILGAHINISSFEGLFGVYEIPYAASFTLSVFAYIVIVNSINLIDGIDGLAATITLIASIAFGLCFFMVDNVFCAVVCFALAGSLLGFLIFNFSPARVFMGDSGSLIIGYVLAVMALKSINYALLPELSADYSEYNKAVLAMTILAYPLMDTLRVFAIRIMNGKSPFTPDNNHIHHALLAKGYTHRQIVFIVAAFAIFLLVSFGFIGKMDGTLVFCVQLAISFTLCFVLLKLPKRALRNG